MYVDVPVNLTVQSYEIHATHCLHISLHRYFYFMEINHTLLITDKFPYKCTYRATALLLPLAASCRDPSDRKNLASEGVCGVHGGD
jgi:hypothetical protein